MFKGNNEDTRTTSMMSSVQTADFEQVNVCWVYIKNNMNKVHSTETGHAVIAYLFCSNEPENWGTSRFSNY